MLFKPSCDSHDVSTSDEQMPELQVNDLIILYYYMGAYTTSAGTKFNGFYSFVGPIYLAYSAQNWSGRTRSLSHLRTISLWVSFYPCNNFFVADFVSSTHAQQHWLVNCEKAPLSHIQDSGVELETMLLLLNMFGTNKPVSSYSHRFPHQCLGQSSMAPVWYKGERKFVYLLPGPK